MIKSPPQLDDLFGALADPTRRVIVERLLAEGELSVGEVAAPLAISAPAVTRHLQVLERAGVIEKRTHRQWRYVSVRPDALAPAESWIARQRRHWMGALDRLEALAAERTPPVRKS
jgi:DNA-binding transcriptional ArsR family regulator